MKVPLRISLFSVSIGKHFVELMFLWIVIETCWNFTYFCGRHKIATHYHFRGFYVIPFVNVVVIDVLYFFKNTLKWNKYYLHFFRKRVINWFCQKDKKKKKKKIENYVAKLLLLYGLEYAWMLFLVCFYEKCKQGNGKESNWRTGNITCTSGRKQINPENCPSYSETVSLYLKRCITRLYHANWEVHLFFWKV